MYEELLIKAGVIIGVLAVTFFCYVMLAFKQAIMIGKYKSFLVEKKLVQQFEDYKLIKKPLTIKFEK